MPDWYDVTSWTTELWSAVGTMITAGTAVAAAGFAWQQVRHARELREEQAQPVVVVDFEPSRASGQFMDLVIRNTGQTIAFDVAIEFDPPLSSTLDDGKYDVAKSSMLIRGIPTLPPGKEHRALFENMPDRFDETTGRFDRNGHSAEYYVTVSFRGSSGKTYSPLSYRLSLDTYGGVERLVEMTFHDFAKDFHEFGRKLSGAVSGSEFRVAARDQDYRSWSDNWHRRRTGRTPSLGRPFPAGRRAPHKYDYLENGPEVTEWAPPDESSEQSAEPEQP